MSVAVEPLCGERLAQVAAVCRNWPILRLSVFGSVARGEAHPESDIDVLLEIDPDVQFTLIDRVYLRKALMELWGRDVHLLERESLDGYGNRFLRRSVLADAQVIYEATSD